MERIMNTTPWARTGSRRRAQPLMAAVIVAMTSAVFAGASIAAASAVGSRAGVESKAHSMAETTNKPPLPTLLTCANTEVLRPQQFVVDCRSSRAQLEGVHWSNWTADSASGSGIWVVDNCIPNCASGRVTRQHSIVAARTPVPAHKGTVFYLLTVTYQTNSYTDKEVWIAHRLFSTTPTNRHTSK